MAIFRANVSGVIIQFVSTYQAEAAPINAAPAGTAYAVRFDEVTNPGLVAAYGANAGAFTMPGGTLCQDDTPVTINPPAAFYAGVVDAAGILQKANSGTPHNWTTEEIDRIAAVAFRGAGLG